MNYRVAFVEDDLFFNKILKNKFNSIDNIELVGGFSTGEALVDELPYLNVNLIFVDLGLPKMSGIEVVREIKKFNEFIKVVVLTASNDEETIIKCVSAGTDGYILKKDLLLFLDENTILNMENQVPMSFEASKKIFDFFKKKSSEEKDIETLTVKEQNVLKLMADGLQNKEIADKIILSVESVKKISQVIYQKLNVRNRSEAISQYFNSKKLF